jgi:YggT family protein
MARRAWLRPETLVPPAHPRYTTAALSGAVSRTRRSSMRALLDVVLIVLQLYVWLLIASAVLSWLIAFNVVNMRNQFVSAVAEFLYRITEPLLRPIRSFLPNLGGIDLSPIVLILIIFLIERIILYYIYPNVF